VSVGADIVRPGGMLSGCGHWVSIAFVPFRSCASNALCRSKGHSDLVLMSRMACINYSYNRVSLQFYNINS
jgi:hypothetical protein